MAEQRRELGAGGARLAVAAGAALYGGITFGGRVFADRGFSLMEISLTGVVFATFLLGALAAVRPQLRPSRRDIDLYLGFGVVGAGLQLSQFTGIVLGVPVAVVALLLYTQPVWTVVLGRWLLAEPITAHKLGAAALAVTGTVALLDPFDVAVAQLPRAGLVAAVVAGLMLSLWVVLTRVSALRDNHPVTTSLGYSAGTTVVLLLLLPVIQAWLAEPRFSRLDPGVWLVHWEAVGLYTLLANIAPALLVMWGMRAVDASSAGVLLLMEPVAAALLAAWAFAEPVTGQILVGGALILTSNVVLIRGARR